MWTILPVRTCNLWPLSISKCKTRVRTGCIVVLLQKIDFQQWRLGTFLGAGGELCVKATQAAQIPPPQPHRPTHPPPLPSPPSTPHSSTVGWSMAAAGGSNSANMSQPSSSVWADRPRQEFELQPTLFVDLPPFVWSSSWVSKRVTQYWPKKIKQNWNGLDYDRFLLKSLPITMPFLYWCSIHDARKIW